jgi:hypothetical protein
MIQAVLRLCSWPEASPLLDWMDLPNRVRRKWTTHAAYTVMKHLSGGDVEQPLRFLPNDMLCEKDGGLIE